MKKLFSACILLIILATSGFSAYKVLEIEEVDQNKQEIIEVPEPIYERFILFGDSGTGDEIQRSVARAIEEYCEVNLCINGVILGDVIYETGIKSLDDPQFVTKFQEPYKNINFPFLIMYGNHDYVGCRECFLNYISAKWIMPAAYYKYQLSDNIDAFVINTENFVEVQQVWLRNELAISSAKWKLVMGHRPITSYEVIHYQEKWKNKEKLAEIICNSADVYFAGHAHAFEDNNNLESCSVRQINAGTGGIIPRQAKLNNLSTIYIAKNGFVSLYEKDDNLVIDFLNTQNEIEYETEIFK